MAIDKKTDSDTPHYHHGDLRNALLQAAEQLLVEQGVAGLSLRAVAKQAGVSHAAPYRHFRDKAALLRALAQSGFERLAAVMQTATDTVAYNPELKLVEAGVAYVRLAVDQPEISQLMFGGSVEPQNDEAYQQAARAAFEALVEIIREGVSTGVFRDRDLQELALVAWTAMHGMAMLMTAHLLDAGSMGQADLDEQVRSVARNVIYGISK
jgi:AcrR family transcriptional regulator